MSWNDLHPDVQHAATLYLTQKQLDIYKLTLAGLGARRIATMLDISRSSVRDHLHAAHDKLEYAGVVHDETGWHTNHQEAA